MAPAQVVAAGGGTLVPRYAIPYQGCGGPGTSRLPFSAGPDGESHGLLGKIVVAH